jgi:hypothetical protein
MFLYPLFAYYPLLQVRLRTGATSDTPGVHPKLAFLGVFRSASWLLFRTYTLYNRKIFYWVHVSVNIKATKTHNLISLMLFSFIVLKFN